MTDLRFMIVNSNLQHAQQIVHELQNRVSFDVYQDTKEKNIWGLLDGGKDDIYVYDRCGRLAYYIPFPLSIMNNEEGSLVTSAILATYYRSPCGSTCEKNSSTLEDFLSNVDAIESPVDTTTDEVSITTELYTEIAVPYQTENAIDLLDTNTSSIIKTIDTKANHSEHFSEFDYPTYDETLEDYDNNETNPKHDHAFFNTLYNYFFKSDTIEQPETLNSNETLSANASSKEFDDSNSIFVPLNISEHDILESYNNTTPPEIDPTRNPTPKPKADRCAEADPSVCRNWSKKRLLRAHNCCSSMDAEDESQNQPRFCKNFGKKRCKKIKTILKCCIKTALFEGTTVPEEITEEVETTNTTYAPTEVSDIVCCRDVDEGKVCRVSEEPNCEVGEYLQESVQPQIGEEPMRERTM